MKTISTTVLTFIFLVSGSYVSGNGGLWHPSLPREEPTEQTPHWEDTSKQEIIHSSGYTFFSKETDPKVTEGSTRKEGEQIKFYTIDSNESIDN